MYDVTALGELLIDFTPAGKNDQGCLLFAQNPGGAPANVLAAANRLGVTTAFIGKVGNDTFGGFLRKTLEDAGISIQGLVVSKTVHTTLAFVQLDEKGDRSFSFYRNPGADMMLTSGEVSEELIAESRIFHFGSVSMTAEPARDATFHAVQLAQEHGCIISYDPNYRPLLWSSEQEAIVQMRRAASFADIIKVSEEELTLLTGKSDLESGSQALVDEGASLVLVSQGSHGAFYRCGSLHGRLPTYDVKTVDTTGAGDVFFGAVLFRLCSKSLQDICMLSRDELEDVLRFGNAAGALTTTKYGAISAIPDLANIDTCMQEFPLLMH